MNRGMFIVFEGLDGAGTTTQSNMLKSRFENEGIKTLHTWEPSENKIGLLIRSFLKKEVSFEEKSAALLFAADRMEHINKVIEPALKDGVNVICDRYVLSSYAYQSVFICGDFTEEINKYHLAPDITFLIDLDADVSLNRKGEEESEHYEELVFQQKVRKNYLSYALKYEKTHNIKMINGTLTPGDVHHAVYDEVSKLL
jgi:dTMP kinase